MTARIFVKQNHRGAPEHEHNIFAVTVVTELHHSVDTIIGISRTVMPRAEHDLDVRLQSSPGVALENT